MLNKGRLINYLVNTGKQPQETWLDLAIRFNFKPNKSNRQRAKAANDVGRKLDKKNQYNLDIKRGYGLVAEDIDPKRTGRLEYNPKEDTGSEYFNNEVDVPEGMEIKSKWQNAAGKWLVSYKKAADGVTDAELHDRIVESVSKFSPKCKLKDYSSKFNRNNPTIAYQINLPDFHIGRVPLNESRMLFESIIAEAISRVKNYNVERIIFPIGNDLLNSDTVVPTPKGGGYMATTAGTSQDDTASQEDTFDAAWKILVEAIEYLQTIAPVYVYNITGNHDKRRSKYVASVVQAWFRNNENVIVDNTNDSFKFHQYGQNMTMFHHGDKIKLDKFPIIMATENPIMFSECRYKQVHLGHLHKYMADEIRGIELKHLPSVARNSAWETESGYKHQRRALCIKYHAEIGEIGTEQINLV